ncbi:D-amino-acid oxidase-like isoform X3 [Ostrea edulis]|uniref:D-amino-acid oxidase-like isoform X3 n=1 Tax=Ostrea edulis TaxID=37623 RepID=UPI0020964381|nr:D-amino-acid oxidase-like isoform X3 [Ostrea edulis]
MALTFRLMKKPRVCVVGAGVIGLSTAVRIQNELPNYDVTVLADRFSPDTTSDGSGGFWQPHLVGGDNQDMVIFGMFYTTVMIHVKAYLSWLMSRFKHNNGNVIDARIDKLEDLVKEYDVIVNCTGLGARKLINDHDVTPIRGQVTRVKAPWVKLFMTYQGTHGHCENYILPGADAVVLGGTGQEGNWNTGVDDEDRKMILEGCVEMMPSLKEAEVVRHWTGLRPHRTSGVRLETERLAKGKLVVHNYGHGGAGVTLHWGCAGQVVREIRTAFTPNFSRL